MLNSINVASSGLSAAREQVENVMNNIANENTPGYKKRVVNINEAEQVDGRITGRGVSVGDISRVTNVYVYDNLTGEKSKQAQYDELSVLLADIESVFYETEDSGFSADLDRYFQSIEDLRSNPSNEIYKNNLRNQGQILVDDLQTLYSDIESREVIALNNVDDYVIEINSILQDIGNINYQMSVANTASNDLLDKRDQLEQELSEYIDIDIDRSYDYELKIGGMTAVRFETNIHNVELVNNTTPQIDVYTSETDFSSNLINTATWSAGDSVTYKLDNTSMVTVTHGETILDSNGNAIDLNGDGVVDASDNVNETNVIKALVYKINNDTSIAAKVTAYNGQYSIDRDGNKVLTNDSSHPGYDNGDLNFDLTDLSKDKYLMIESTVAGDKGQFNGSIIVNDDALAAPVEVDRSIANSEDGIDDVHLEIFDKELTLKSGKLKPILENLSTESNNNLFASYKERLDNLAAAISDISSSYIEDGNEYIYGTELSDTDLNHTNKIDLGLFSGSSVDTLVFNEAMVAGLTQSNLDYLSSIQWKEDINIDGVNKTSLSRYNQATRVKISDDKENIDFKKETQDAVTQSLQLNYDKLVKVDKDSEMMDLIKFQAAYEANAKLITMIDEMLATILGMRR